MMKSVCEFGETKVSYKDIFFCESIAYCSISLKRSIEVTRLNRDNRNR